MATHICYLHYLTGITVSSWIDTMYRIIGPLPYPILLMPSRIAQKPLANLLTKDLEIVISVITLKLVLLSRD